MTLLVIERFQQVFPIRRESVELLAFPLFSHFDHALLSKFLEMRIDIVVRQPQVLGKPVAMGWVRLNLAQNLQFRLRDQTHYYGIADPVGKVMQTELLTGSEKSNNSKLFHTEKDR